MARHRPQEAGFTILEFMMTIALAVAILGIAIPNFTEFMRNNRMSAAANDFMTSVHAARSESVKRHMPTVVCFTTNTNPTATTAACNGNGTQGWMAFVDDIDPAVAAPTDNNGQLDANEVLLQHHVALAPLMVRLAPAVNNAYIAFAPTGFARNLPALGVPITGLVICDDRGNVAQYGAGQSAARAISISPVGRPATTRAIADISALGGCP